MEKILLTKREYLGEGYCHIFRNIATEEQKMTLITKEEYERLGGLDGSNYNPSPEEGWQYIMSYGGFPILNTQDSIGDHLDGFIKENLYYVFEIDKKFKQLNLNQYTEEEFNTKFIWQ